MSEPCQTLVQQTLASMVLGQAYLSLTHPTRAVMAVIEGFALYEAKVVHGELVNNYVWRHVGLCDAFDAEKWLTGAALKDLESNKKVDFG